MAAPAPLIAVSPIVAGRARKGPTATLMAERGLEAEGGISISGTMANTGAAAAG